MYYVSKYLSFSKNATKWPKCDVASFNEGEWISKIPMEKFQSLIRGHFHLCVSLYEATCKFIVENIKVGSYLCAKTDFFFLPTDR